MRNTRSGRNVIFRGMSPNIPGNVLKHSGKCPQTFRGMSSNIPGNVAKHSGESRQIFREWPQTFQGMLPNLPGNVPKHSGKCRQTFRGMSLKISGNVLKQSRKYLKIIWPCCKTSCGKYESVQMNVHNSTRYWWSWTLPIGWRTVTVKL